MCYFPKYHGVSLYFPEWKAKFISSYEVEALDL